MKPAWIIPLVLLAACSKEAAGSQEAASAKQAASQQPAVRVIKADFDIAYQDMGYPPEKPMMWFYNQRELTALWGERSAGFQSGGQPHFLEKCPMIKARLCVLDQDLSDIPIYIRESDDGRKAGADEDKLGRVSVDLDAGCQKYKIVNGGEVLKYRYCPDIGIVEIVSTGGRSNERLVLRSFYGLGSRYIH